MKYLLDTCVISELTRKQPSDAVLDWISAQEEENYFLSSLTIGELKKGIARFPPSHKKMTLQAWLDQDMRQRFAGRILSIDIEVAEQWGLICAHAEKQGLSLPVVDGLIAATALAHGLIVVTRNTSDMEPSGVPLLNPWEKGK
ncbi:MAG: type II toxin-antitoxin system VapC family toxin [Kiritimatiellales bacterium]